MYSNNNPPESDPRHNDDAVNMWVELGNSAVNATKLENEANSCVSNNKDSQLIKGCLTGVRDKLVVIQDKINGIQVNDMSAINSFSEAKTNVTMGIETIKQWLDSYAKCFDKELDSMSRGVQCDLSKEFMNQANNYLRDAVVMIDANVKKLK